MWGKNKNSKQPVSFFAKVKRFVRRIVVFLLISHFLYLIYGIWFNPPITFTQLVSVFKGYGLNRDYVDMDEISPNMKLAVIASEDQLFTDHNGFDIKAIKLAIKYNKKHPNRPRGASTISQQVAKNVFLWQGGGFFRKGLEVYFTVMIELFWSKKRILEVYLNIAEMGKGVFGVEAASQKYFNKPASQLTKYEASQIAACLPNPIKFTVVPKSNYVASRADDIMQQMSNLSSDVDIIEIIENEKPNKANEKVDVKNGKQK